MVFEKILKGVRGSGVEPMMISIARTMASFGCEIANDLREKGSVEIYFDREENKVGFKSTNSRITGFALSKEEKGSGMRISSKTLCQSVPVGQYLATKEDDMWVIKVPEIAKKNE